MKMRKLFNPRFWIKKLLMPKILRRMDVGRTMNPRRSSLQADRSVYCFKDSKDIDIWKQIEAVKADLFRGFKLSDRILIKINLNTADPYPASTDPETLVYLLNLLADMGFNNLTVGDCSSLSALPTRNVFKKMGLADRIKDKARMVCFDDGKWVSIPVGGEYLQTMVVPDILFEVDKIIYLANLKTHRWADFSMSLKLAVGLMHPRQRDALHTDFLQEKVVETALAVEPDLVFLDAREAFITLGPEQGDTARGDSILAGRDMLAVDLEGYRLLYKLKQKNDCLENFTEDPFKMRQFRHATKILNH